MGVAFDNVALKKGPIYPAVALLHCAGCTIKGELPVPGCFKWYNQVSYMINVIEHLWQFEIPSIKIVPTVIKINKEPPKAYFYSKKLKRVLRKK